MKLSTTLLAVADINASSAFYEALGFHRQQGGGALAFLSDGTRTIALGKRELIATLDPKGSGKGSIQVFFAKSDAEVDESLVKALSSGATILREAQPGDWGGYGGSFADTDGHVWAVLHNPALHRG